MLDVTPVSAAVTGADRTEAATLESLAYHLDELAEAAACFAARLREMAFVVRTRGAACARAERETVENAAALYIVRHAAVTCAFRRGLRASGDNAPND